MPIGRTVRGLVLLAAAAVAVSARSGSGAEPGGAPGTTCEPPAAVVETGATCDALAGFDELMRTFVRDEGIPGASLAVAKDGRLVYARGFGYANMEAKRPVEPDSLFRIASVSKPITAVAVLRLVDQGKLKLDDRVFELLPHQPHLPCGGKADPRLREITVRQCLQHTAGWDRDVSIDPMFHPIEIATILGTAPPAGPDQIIRFMMGWTLDFDPGTRHAYSNFGYCLLGRVIEQVSGRGYEQFVREDVLGPLGIRSMRIGRTLRRQQAEGEVCYYAPGDRTGLAVVGDRPGSRVPRPYGAWYLEAMDSHGGWIASAVDLVRFGVDVQQAPQSGLLSDGSTRAMSARPDGPPGQTEDGQPRRVYYGLGWSVRQTGDDGKINVWHTGRFDGSSALLVLRHDGLCWAVLLNTSATPDGQAPAGKIDPRVHQAADGVARWPEGDLFSRDWR